MINSLYEYDRSFIKDKKVIIYGIFKESQILAMRLIQEDIYFAGFMFPGECTKLKSLLNKQVFQTEEIIADTDNIAIIVPYKLKNKGDDFAKKYPEAGPCISYETIKKQILDAEKRIVYGSGKRAELLQKNLPDLNISYYLDSSKEKAGTLYNGKKVCHPSILKEQTGSIAIIIASIHSAAMYKTLREYGCADEEIFVDPMDIVIHADSEIRINLFPFLQLGKELYKKNVTLYGEKNTVEMVKKILGHLEITFSNVIGRDTPSEDGTIYDIFYQERGQTDLILMTDKPNSLQHEILLNMNYAERNILYLATETFFYSYRKHLLHMGLDPILGYGKFSENKKSMLFSEHIWINAKTQTQVPPRPDCDPGRKHDRRKRHKK
ncbi:hypothetical protein AALA98_16735 [Lachnospiraceae bacterium 45-W7]